MQNIIGYNNEFKWHLFDGKIQWYYEYYRDDIDDDDWEELSIGFLNKEVEIIEEDKKIEKFDPCLGGIMGFDSVENIFETYKDKINEIIDKINGDS